MGLCTDKRLDEQDKPVLIKVGKNSFILKVMEFIYGILNYPDEHKGWYPFALSAGRKLMENKEIDAILSSSHPMTTHLIARKLRNTFHIPWIADLRDLWTQNHYYQYGPIRKWFERNLEIKTLSYADALVTVSQPLAETLHFLHKTKDVFSIPNGFDPEEIRPVPLTQDFTITYTGRLYDGKRDPSLLFRALQELLRERKVDPNFIKIRFWGSTAYWLEQEIKQYKLEKIACQYGLLPREDILMKQRESQLLLLLNWNDPREQGVYTGKVFEYLAAKRPIIAIGPKGVVSQLLRETNAGIHTSDPDSLKGILLEFYQEFRLTGKIAYCGEEEEINKYSHVEMARKFADVLNQITQNPTGTS